MGMGRRSEAPMGLGYGLPSHKSFKIMICSKQAMLSLKFNI
jgi:hypothetical protein